MRIPDRSIYKLWNSNNRPGQWVSCPSFFQTQHENIKYGANLCSPLTILSLMRNFSAEFDNSFVKQNSIIVLQHIQVFFRYVFLLIENLALYQPTWEQFPLPDESRYVRMLWTVCTLIVELLQVNVQYLITVNTVLHREQIWGEWSASITLTSTI